MGVSYKTVRRNMLKTMYGDIIDAYLEELQKNTKDKEAIAEKKRDAKAWKEEFSELIKDL